MTDGSIVDVLQLFRFGSSDYQELTGKLAQGLAAARLRVDRIGPYDLQPARDAMHMQLLQRRLDEYFAYYNRDRKHSSIGYQTPRQFETNLSGRK